MISAERIVPLPMHVVNQQQQQLWSLEGRKECDLMEREFRLSHNGTMHCGIRLAFVKR
jgi:hypothetical protein